VNDVFGLFFSCLLVMLSQLSLSLSSGKLILSRFLRLKTELAFGMQGQIPDADPAEFIPQDFKRVR